MPTASQSILSINGGSSSLKFALHELSSGLGPLLEGKIEKIGTAACRLKYQQPSGPPEEIDLAGKGMYQAAQFLADWLKEQSRSGKITGIGHRIVHGMDRASPSAIGEELMEALTRIAVYDPEHMPAQIELIRLFEKVYPGIPQFACFDTSFHQSMPLQAKMLGLPRRYFENDIHRYGFHGLSYTFLIKELERVAGEREAKGKVVIAHLGNGASIAAVKAGKSIDTSMGFTPSSGILMSSRAGDLDPGVVSYLLREEKMDEDRFSRLVNDESGLLGISGSSADISELINKRKEDPFAAEAIALFSYQVKKCIGAYAAALGGIDTLVFSGGIGEHLPLVRSACCEQLEFLGIAIDEKRNATNSEIISPDTARVSVRVIRTNEELVIARMLADILLNT